MDISIAFFQVSAAGFPAGENIVCGSLALVVVSSVVQKVFKDALLSDCYFAVLAFCYALIILCFSTILSRLCIQESKTNNKTVWRLKDPDIEFSDEEESEKDRERKRFCLLIKSRRIYEIIYKIALLFLIVGLILEVLSYNYDASLKSDFDAAALTLAFTAGCLLILIYKVADTYRWEPVKYSYQPFDEFIRVPMKVVVPKIYLYVADNLLYFGSLLFFQFSAIYGVVSVYRMSEEDFKRFIDATGITEIHIVMRAAMITANISAIMLIINYLVTASDFVMDDLLFTCEKNWHWNMAAIEFLLQENEFNSLEELAEAILEKSQKEDLTEEEEKALKYIQKPLWKSKPPFIGNRELSGIPEALRKAKQAEPSTSNPTEGSNEEHQPSTSNQPSSSTQRPLRVG